MPDVLLTHGYFLADDEKQRRAWGQDGDDMRAVPLAGAHA
jgi:hypothetical protein